MSLADRLRSIVRPDGPATGGPHDNDCPHDSGCRGRLQAAHPKSVADLLGGEYREWHGHPYVVIERKYLPGHRHGRTAVADSAPEGDGWTALSILAPAYGRVTQRPDKPALAGRSASADRPGRMLFIDLETTGLAGGAGTYAFLVGCGWFEGATFRVRQFLLAGYGAEPGLLEQVADTVRAAGALATYNGKTFDLPLIETRFLLHRMPTPFDDIPHLDMLHPARRLWRSGGSASPGFNSTDPANTRQTTCRLVAVEEAVLGHVREGEIPGFEIPSRYFQYVRSGDPWPLTAVLEHNRLDLLSLAMLTARAAQLLEHGVTAAGTAREALGLGRLYQHAGMLIEARACFARAAAIDTGDVATRVEALRAYAVLCRRARRYDEAADAWQGLLELHRCPPHVVQEATEALAVHHEHRRRDFRAAREFALRSLQVNSSLTRKQAAQHRLARLDRKLAAPLF